MVLAVPRSSRGGLASTACISSRLSVLRASAIRGNLVAIHCSRGFTTISHHCSGVSTFSIPSKSIPLHSRHSWRDSSSRLCAPTRTRCPITIYRDLVLPSRILTATSIPALPKTQSEVSDHLAVNLGARYDLQTFSTKGLESNPLWPASGRV